MILMDTRKLTGGIIFNDLDWSSNANKSLRISIVLNEKSVVDGSLDRSNSLDSESAGFKLFSP